MIKQVNETQRQTCYKLLPMIVKAHQISRSARLATLQAGCEVVEMLHVDVDS